MNESESAQFLGVELTDENPYRVPETRSAPRVLRVRRIGPSWPKWAYRCVIIGIPLSISLHRWYETGHTISGALAVFSLSVFVGVYLWERFVEPTLHSEW